MRVDNNNNFSQAPLSAIEEYFSNIFASELRFLDLQAIKEQTLMDREITAANPIHKMDATLRLLVQKFLNSMGLFN